MKKINKSLLPLAITSVCLNSYAQETTNNVTMLEPVTVTARGFSENILNTPFVVNTITSDTIKNENLTDAQDVIRGLPSSSIHNGGNVAYSFLSMRGTGSLSITSLDDNSVDFRVDGISNGKTGLARNLIDIEKIEVAKGPQGTLLGSKAEAGIYIIKTNDPEDEFDANIGLGIGNLQQKSAEAVLNLPLSNNFSVRVAGMTQQKDNYLIKNEDNHPLNKKKKQGIQAKIGWHDDSYKHNVVLGLYHDKQTNNIPLLQTDFSSYKVDTFKLPHDSENTAKGLTLKLESDLDFANFISNTGYHKYTGHILRPAVPPEVRGIHYGPIPQPIWPVLDNLISKPENNRQRLEDEYSQISQEFRLVSKPEDEIKWVAGLYLEKKKRTMHNDGKLDFANLSSLSLPGPFAPFKPMIIGAINAGLINTAGNGDFYKTSKTSTQAIFGEVTYPATQKLDIIAGARVTHTKLKHSESWQGNSNNVMYGAAKKFEKTYSKTALTGRLGLSYTLQPNWRIYALQSRGYQFGVFDDYNTNLVYGNAIEPYKSTVTNASEIGTKYVSDDSSLQLSVAIFQNKMKNARVKIGGLPPLYDTKSGNVDAYSRGLEINAKWQATDNFQLYGDIAFTKTKVTRVPQKVELLNISKVGNEMPQVPKVSSSIGIKYQDDTSFLTKGKWFADINYRYVGSRYGQANNVQKLASYGLINASVGVMNEHHSLMLWGKNLNNKKYLNIGVQPTNVGTLAQGRSFGLKYNYQF